MKNLKFIPVLLFLIFALTASNSFAEKPIKQVWVWTIPWSFDSACGNNGEGETVSGTITLKFIRIWKDKGWTGITLPLGEDLVGEESGEIFNALGAASVHVNFNNDGTNGTTNYINHYHGDMGTKVKIFTKLHFTINANGETTVEWDHSSTDCKSK